MAKFNNYRIVVWGADTRQLMEKTVPALSLESAWHKAVEEAFEAKEAGDIPETISVHRLQSASEYHG